MSEELASLEKVLRFIRRKEQYCKHEGYIEESNWTWMAEVIESYLNTRAQAPVPDGVDVETALRFAAQVVELWDDATMDNDHMADSAECAAILNVLADHYHN
jgi:hypothetical protein